MEEFSDCIRQGIVDGVQDFVEDTENLDLYKLVVNGEAKFNYSFSVIVSQNDLTDFITLNFFLR